MNAGLLLLNPMTATMGADDPLFLAGLATLAGIVLLLWLFLWFFPIKLWIAARVTKTPVGLLDLVFMRMRRVPPARIVNPLICATAAGVRVSRLQLESHYLAGGNPQNVVAGMIAASKLKADLPVEQACELDLAGLDVVAEVKRRNRRSVQPNQ
jgi:uncharacterized protein YqfA (UPF0365 family)